MSEQRPPAHPPIAPPARNRRRTSRGRSCAGSPPRASRCRAAARRSPPRRCSNFASPMRAPATPCTRRSTTRACAPSSRRSGCPCSRSRARRRTASTTSCGPTSAAGSPTMPRRVLAAHAGSGYDVAFVVADGLSARAVATHAQPLLAQVLPRLADWRIAPLVVARLGRVALGDAVAQRAPRRDRGDADRRAAGPVRARQHGRLPHLRAHAANQRRRAQLHLQHPARGPCPTPMPR